MHVSLPYTWSWLLAERVPPNYTRLEAHPTNARWAVSYEAKMRGEFALCVGSDRPYGPTWHSVDEAVRQGWIAKR